MKRNNIYINNKVYSLPNSNLTTTPWQWHIREVVIVGGQMAEWLGNRAINQKVAGLIPCRVKFGQGTSPYLPQGNVPLPTVSHSG